MSWSFVTVLIIITAHVSFHVWWPTQNHFHFFHHCLCFNGLILIKKSYPAKLCVCASARALFSHLHNKKANVQISNSVNRNDKIKWNWTLVMLQFNKLVMLKCWSYSSFGSSAAIELYKPKYKNQCDRVRRNNDDQQLQNATNLFKQSHKLKRLARSTRWFQ